MAAAKSRKLFLFYIYFVLFRSVTSQDTTGMHFKLIKGVNMEYHAGDTSSLIQKQFFQCGREKSCTHVIQLTTNFVTVHGSNELEMKKGSAVRIYEKVELKGKWFCFPIYHKRI